jgi:hypothetical protein
VFFKWGMAELLPMPTTSKYIYILKKTTIFFKKNTPKPPKTVQKRLFHSENTLKKPKISPKTPILNVKTPQNAQNWLKNPNFIVKTTQNAPQSPQ